MCVFRIKESILLNKLIIICKVKINRCNLIISETICEEVGTWNLREECHAQLCSYPHHQIT